MKSIKTLFLSTVLSLSFGAFVSANAVVTQLVEKLLLLNDMAIRCCFSSLRC